MQLHGFHHLTAVTADAAGNHDFYTRPLGLRLVKKTVNQDDVSAYHLFYADGLASPGTDVTFFDWPVLPEKRGTNSIVRTGFRVADTAALDYWYGRLKDLKHVPDAIVERDNRPTLDFEDREGQRLRLVVDPAAGDGHPWAKSPVPAAHQIQGLGPITISVPDLAPTEKILTGLMNMRAVRQYVGPATDGSRGTAPVHVFEMDTGGPAAELHVAVEKDLRRARQGAGGVHHVAFRLHTFEEYDAWADRLRSFGVASSGPVDRYYFRSLYFREPNGILFELATDGPGFASDEPMESLGERLALPPFLEPNRANIEAGLKPLTTRPAEGSVMNVKDPHAGGLLRTAGPSVEAARAAVVMVHGRGATTESILSLYAALDVPDLAAVAPQAAGGTWYPYSFLQPMPDNQPYLDSALRRVETVVDDLLARGVPSEKIALLGFSQGACLTSEFVARHPRKYGAVLVLSGGLIGPPGTPRNYAGDLAGTPVFIGAGDPDPHVPFERVRETEAVLTRMGASVDVRRYPGRPHTVSEDEVEACRVLLRAVT